jgi:hypothetical protein
LTPFPQSPHAVGQLCPQCGLCCNGVLFGDVELRRGDDARRLGELGLTLHRAGRKMRFSQPCACFDGQWCGIYADRPTRCRAFECRLLKRVNAGDLPAAAALRTIAQARRRVETVRELVRRLGQTEESLPLSRRYARAIAQPENLTGGAEARRLRSELLLAVHELVQVLGREFLT